MTCPICGGALEPDRLLRHAEVKHGVRLPANAGWDCYDCLRNWIEYQHAEVQPGDPRVHRYLRR